jgi:hypothetical protein
VTDTAEDHAELAWLAAAPVVWVGYFLSSYAFVGVRCAGDARSLGPIAWVLAALTVAALAAITGIGLRACRRYARVPAAVPDDDSDLARHRFMALATILLSSLAILGILFVASAAAVVGECR